MEETSWEVLKPIAFLCCLLYNTSCAVFGGLIYARYEYTRRTKHHRRAGP